MADPVAVTIAALLLILVATYVALRCIRTYLNCSTSTGTTRNQQPANSANSTSAAGDSSTLNPPLVSSYGTLVVFIGLSHHEEEHDDRPLVITVVDQNNVPDRPAGLLQSSVSCVKAHETSPDKREEDEVQLTIADVQEDEQNAEVLEGRNTEMECAVCLCDFQRGDLLRRVNACGHLFHKVCHAAQKMLTARCEALLEL